MPNAISPAPPPAAPFGVFAREARGRRILERMRQGWSNRQIAEAEDLTPQRIGQIVRETLARPEVDPAGAYVRLRTAHLDAALQLAERTIEGGNLAGIDRLLRVLDRLDRYQSQAASPPLRGAQRESAARRDQSPRRAAADKAPAAAGRPEDSALGRPPRILVRPQPLDFTQSPEI
jgi:hypothetical protein